MSPPEQPESGAASHSLSPVPERESSCAISPLWLSRRSETNIPISAHALRTLRYPIADRTIAVDLSGMFYCTRLAVPRIKEAGGGSIINMPSIAGRLGHPLRSHYSAAKWGVVGFTKSLAVELGPFNIRVNAVLPGVVEGQRVRQVVADGAKARGIAPDEAMKRFVAPISLKRMVSSDEDCGHGSVSCHDVGAFDLWSSNLGVRRPRLLSVSYQCREPRAKRRGSPSNQSSGQSKGCFAAFGLSAHVKS